MFGSNKAMHRLFSLVVKHFNSLFYCPFCSGGFCDGRFRADGRSPHIAGNGAIAVSTGTGDRQIESHEVPGTFCLHE